MLEMNKKRLAVTGLAAAAMLTSAMPVLADDTAAAARTDRGVSKETEIVNIRSGAGIDTERVGVLLPGSVVQILGRNREWTRIHSGRVDGFIRSDLLATGEEAEAILGNPADTGLGRVDADILHVRSGASMEDEIVGTMSEGDVLELVSHRDGWYETKYDGGTAWVSEEYVSPEGGVRTALTLEEYEALSDSQTGADADGGAAVQTADPAYFYAIPAASYESWAAESAPAVPEPAAPAYAEETAEYDSSAAGYDSYVPDAYTEESYAAETWTAEDSTLYGTADVQTAPAGAASGDLDLLAAIIQCEAGGESREGKVAVGACVLNRVRDGAFPDTISDVIYENGQFTPAMTGWLEQTMSEGVRDDCYEAAQAALNGENPIGDLLYFHAGGGSGLTIGNQTFY